ncbi:MAG: hypothetical protein Q8L74_12955 [Nitrospirota bacterium]|nr:hypothetical protein [Nitrospirota bacterium]
MRISPDGDVLEAERELEEVGEEIAELEEQLARKRARHAQLHGENEMTPEEKAKSIRKTMGKCAKALSQGSINLNQFCEVLVMARGVQPSFAGEFGKSVRPSAAMGLNQASLLNTLQQNGLSHLVSSSGNWR